MLAVVSFENVSHPKSFCIILLNTLNFPFEKEFKFIVHICWSKTSPNINVRPPYTVHGLLVSNIRAVPNYSLNNALNPVDAKLAEALSIGL